ncbi:hypothetical protein PRIPAC_93813 [Pristionchus pacificus]|uniref:Uncharacterized protein n=1 Tax=Pristionchus pacificus TaxID=54126 RepID=A0A454XY29_PRIPA|nr:hypothetical protein PRIPAC_93813 [Pristionchus pacificus]|eukprot:PDM84934.1 hypothetical protein PRIPAC_36368 [Pristionchus pacificus]
MYFFRPLLLTILLITIIFSYAKEEETINENEGEEIRVTEASPYQTDEIELETPQPFQTFDIEVDDATNSIDDNRRDEDTTE